MLSQIVAVFNHHLSLKLTAGGLVQMWHRLQEILFPWYEQIQAEALNSAVLHADETIDAPIASFPRCRADRADQEPMGEVEPLGPLHGDAAGPLGAQYRRGVAELERERAAQVEVLVPEKESHVLLDREHRARELDAGEEKAEAPFVRKEEAVGFALDRPEPGPLPARAGDPPTPRRSACPFRIARPRSRSSRAGSSGSPRRRRACLPRANRASGNRS